MVFFSSWFSTYCALMPQLVECWSSKLEVVGLNPTPGNIFVLVRVTAGNWWLMVWMDELNCILNLSCYCVFGSQYRANTGNEEFCSEFRIGYIPDQSWLSDDLDRVQGHVGAEYGDGSESADWWMCELCPAHSVQSSILPCGGSTETCS